jgi:hypothetical protein
MGRDFILLVTLAYRWKFSPPPEPGPAVARPEAAINKQKVKCGFLVLHILELSNATTGRGWPCPCPPVGCPSTLRTPLDCASFAWSSFFDFGVDAFAQVFWRGRRTTGVEQEWFAFAQQRSQPFNLVCGLFEDWQFYFVTRPFCKLAQKTDDLITEKWGILSLTFGGHLCVCRRRDKTLEGRALT